jgi:hypothetical protein
VLVPPVTAAAGDGRGGFYVADATGVVHVLADGSRDGTFTSSLSGVDALAVAAGRVFAGGSFGARAVALAASSGQTLAWHPTVRHPVETIVVWHRTVYLGGGAGLSAVDALTGRSRPCRCRFSAPRWHLRESPSIHVLLLAGRRLYVGGYFDTAGGRRHDSLAALDAATGHVTAWRPRPFGRTDEGAPEVFALAGDRQRLYVGGRDLRGLDSGISLVALDHAGQQLWRRRAGWATALARTPTRLLALVDDEPAAFDPRNGRPSAWDPGAESGLRVLARSGSHAFIGGDLGGFGGVRRGGAGALGSGGTPTSWDPRTDGDVWAFAASGSTLYLAGSFSTVGTARRRNLAAVDTTTGAVLPWTPASTLPTWISTVTVAGGKVFVGNGETCDRTPQLYGFDSGSGAAVTWRLGPAEPNSCHRVTAVAGAGSTGVRCRRVPFDRRR